MTKMLLKETVNINCYPETSPVAKGSQLTIGDLHGNALKFLFFLVKHGIVICNEKHYNLFNAIYQKDTNTLTVEDIASIKALCEEFTISNKNRICLIGDVLADRGQNDYFMLLLLAKLHKESVAIDILLSNHDYTLIEALEVGQGFYSNRAWGDRVYARSMHQMQDLINAGKLDSDEINKMLQTAYLPNLKLLSYTVDRIDTHGPNSEITLYHHACIDREVIGHIARKMGVVFNADTVTELSTTIDVMNYVFQKNWVGNNLVHALPLDFSYPVIPKSDPICFLIFNRNYDVLKNTFYTYKVNHVYGHDSNGPIVSGFYCLNGDLGAHFLYNEGEYRVLVSECQKKQAIEVNNFFRNLSNTQLITHKALNKQPLPVEDEDNKENSWTCTLY